MKKVIYPNPGNPAIIKRFGVYYTVFERSAAMRHARLTLSAFFCCLLLAAGTLSSCGQTPAVKDVPKLESAIEKTMNCPGVVFAVHEPGKSDVIITRGVDDLQTSTKISTGDNIRIGSITKTFTAVTMLQLASEGKVSLDDPLSKYEPQVPNSSSTTTIPPTYSREW